jgi:phosphate/sulfate permease
MEEIAEHATLRRLERMAALYGLGGGIALGWWQGVRAGLALTVMAAVSIVAFRTWEGVVRRLEPKPGDAARRRGETRTVLRWALLLAALGAAFVLGSNLLALVLGVTVLPLALITEAGLRLLGIGGGAGDEV